MKEHAHKHFVCAAPREKCRGELTLGLDDEGLLTTNQKVIVKPLFKVHKSYKDSCACTQASIDKGE